jgi:hypothetical protein
LFDNSDAVVGVYDLIADVENVVAVHQEGPRPRELETLLSLAERAAEGNREAGVVGLLNHLWT